MELWISRRSLATELAEATTKTLLSCPALYRAVSFRLLVYIVSRKKVHTCAGRAQFGILYFKVPVLMPFVSVRSFLRIFLYVMRIQLRSADRNRRPTLAALAVIRCDWLISPSTNNAIHPPARLAS